MNDKYNFLNLTKKQLDYIKSKADEIALKEENKDYKIIYEKCLYEYILGLYDDEGSKNYLDNYINGLDKKNKLGCLKDLSSLFDKLNIEPSFEDIFSLVDNHPTIQALLKDVVEEYTEQIVKGHIEQITNDFIITSLIENYCSINNIDYADEIIYEYDDRADLSAEKQFWREIKQYPLLSKEETYELIEKAQNHDKNAYDKLVLHNLRLVAKVANKYAYATKVDFLELVDEGYTGLCKAIEKFDFSKNYAFSTYATWWIRAKIRRAAYELKNSIRYPEHLNEAMLKVYSLKNQLKDQLGREITLEDLLKYKGKLKLTKSQIKNVLALPEVSVRLEQKVKDEDESEIGDFIPSKIDGPEEELLKKNDSEILMKYLECLTPREKSVMIYRHGLFGHPQLTLEAIGEMYNITRERTRQIEIKAFRKMVNFHKWQLLDFNLKKTLKTPSINESFQRSDRMNKFIKDKTEIDNIYDYFKDYSTEQIDKALSLLSNAQKEVLLKRYGPNYKNPIFNDLDNQDRRLLNITYKKIEDILATFSNDKNVEEDSSACMLEGLSGEQVKQFWKKLLNHFPNVPKEKMELTLTKLTKHQIEVLKKKFNIDEDSSSYDLTKAEDGYFYYTIRRIGEVLSANNLDKENSQDNQDKENNKDHKNIYDYFPNSSKEEVERVLSQLTSRQLELLQRKFDVNGDAQNCKLTRNEQSYFCYIIRRIGELLSANNLDKENSQENQDKENNKDHKNIYDYFPDNSKAEVDKALSQLTPRQLEILQRKFNNSDSQNKLSKTEYNYFYSAIRRIKHIINDTESFKKIYDYFEGYDKSIVDEAIYLLNEEQKEILCKKYGLDLDNPRNNRLSKNDRALFYNVIKRLTRLTSLLAVIKDKKYDNLYSYFSGFSQENLSTVLKTLSAKEKKFLNNVYDNDIFKAVKHSLSIQNVPHFIRLIEKIRIRLEILEEQRTKEEVYLLNIENVLDIKEIISILGEYNALIWVLRFGYFKGKKFTAKEIGSFLKISEEEVINICYNCIELLQNYLTTNKEKMEKAEDSIKKIKIEDYLK